MIYHLKFIGLLQKTRNGVAKSKQKTISHYSKKKDCPAQIVIREIVVFVDFSLPPVSQGIYHRQRKKELIKELRHQVSTDKVQKVTRFYVQVPLPQAHSFHALPPTKMLSPCPSGAQKGRKKLNKKFVDVLSELSKMDYMSVTNESLLNATQLLQQVAEIIRDDSGNLDKSHKPIHGNNLKDCKIKNGSQAHRILQETQNEPVVNNPPSVTEPVNKVHQYSSTRQTALAEMVPCTNKSGNVLQPFPLPSLSTQMESHFFHTPLYTVQTSQHMQNGEDSCPWRQF